LDNGIRVSAWTVDEMYGRDSKFLDGIEERKQVLWPKCPPIFTAG
jgi:hypothetical protein